VAKTKELCVQVVIPLLKQLSEAEGITGFERPVCELLRQIWGAYVDEMHVDKLGSLVALKRGAPPGGQPKLMLAAHMDEIGLRVTGVEKGFLRVTRVGGADRRVLLGLEVVVHGRRDLPGIVATRPPHVLHPEEVEQLVSVGDLISFRGEVAELKNRRLAGKAFDDRACVAIITLVLEQLAQMRHDWDVFTVATVQEEIGLKGAVASAYGVAPDLAIALDVTFGKQPGVPDVDAAPLGEGPVVSIGPNFHPGVVARLKEVAEAHEIPYQLEPAPGRLGTDAWAIQVSREGVPTGLICLPLRYMHQPVETLDVRDVERAARLLAAFVAGLEADFFEKLASGYAKSQEG
jgi:putative aminopeptidase FrvX